MDWELAASLSGSLRQIVAWSDGFAAIHFPDGDGLTSATPRRELWYSDDGIDWEAAPVTPGFEQVYTLAGHDGDLFALTGDFLDFAAPQTLWHRSSEAPWEQVLSHELLQHVAIGANRVIAYLQNPFHVLGVYDAASLEQVEFDGIPDLERPEQIPGPGRVPDFPSGAVIGLDDGFLAVSAGRIRRSGPPSVSPGCCTRPTDRPGPNTLRTPLTTSTSAKVSAPHRPSTASTSSPRPGRQSTSPANVC